jgi:hypothetical protein
MSRPAGNTPDQMTNAIKLESTLNFAVDYLPNEGRLAPLLVSGAAS